MSSLTAFAWSVAGAVGAASIAVLLLRRSLGALLLELCGSRERAGFWSIFCSVTIVLASSIGMLASFPLSDGRGWEGHPELPVALSALRTSLVFLLLALGTLGFVLLLGIASYERRRRAESFLWGSAGRGASPSGSQP